MICNKCGAELPDDSNFCLKCGNKLEIPAPQPSDVNDDVSYCHECGQKLKNGAVFCHSCGTKVICAVQAPYNNGGLSAVSENSISEYPQDISSYQNTQYSQSEQYAQSVRAMPVNKGSKGRSNLALIIILIFAAVLLTGGLTAGFFIWKNMNSFSIDDAKDGYFEEISKYTIGELLEKIHVDPDSYDDEDDDDEDTSLWQEKKSLTGSTVIFEGKNKFNGKEAEIHFVKGEEEDRPEVAYVSIDGDETDKDDLIKYIADTYSKYLDKDILKKSKGKKKKSSEKTTAAIETTVPEIVFTTEKTTTTTASPFAAGYTGELKTGGDKFTILSWNPGDAEPMLNFWQSDRKIPDDKVDFVNFSCSGGEASTAYDQYFLSGDDIDMFMVEADWALKYMNDDSLTAPMSALGFTDRDFANQYYYTLEVGRNSQGILKGVSWQAAPGAWCYRSDLAESYLGVKSPAEMQSMVSDWDGFLSTAGKVYSASGGKTSITTTLNGMWQAYSCGLNRPLVMDSRFELTNQCRDFIKLAKAMSDSGYVTGVTQWSDEWYKTGQTDITMGYFISTWGFGDAVLLRAAGGQNGITYSKWACTEGPSPFFWGGNWLCVTPFTDNADMAADFIRYFTINDDSMIQYAVGKDGYEFVNNMSVMQNIIDYGYNKNGNLGGQDQFAVLHENAKNINLSGVITPYDPDIKYFILDSVTDYCKGTIKSEADCIENIKNRVASSFPDVKTN